MALFKKTAAVNWEQFLLHRAAELTEGKCNIHMHNYIKYSVYRMIIILIGLKLSLLEKDAITKITKRYFYSAWTLRFRLTYNNIEAYCFISMVATAVLTSGSGQS